MVDEAPPPPDDDRSATPPPPPPPPVTPPSGSPPPAPGYAPPGHAPPGYASPGYGQVPPPPPPGYGGPPYGTGYQYGARTEGNAIAAFVVALVGLFVCGIVTGIVALVLANNAQQKIAASGGQLTGTAFVTWARVIAIISIILSVLGIVLVVATS